MAESTSFFTKRGFVIFRRLVVAFVLLSLLSVGFLRLVCDKGRGDVAKPPCLCELLGAGPSLKKRVRLATD
jgi:hypothetical protein